MPVAYTVEQYVNDLRAIRNIGSATPETSFYRPLDNLLNAVGKSLKPVVLFSSQLRNQGAGSPMEDSSRSIVRRAPLSRRSSR